MSSSKHCEYVSIRGLAAHCDHRPRVLRGDTRLFDKRDYQDIRNGDRVYVVTSVLDKFIQQVFPQIVRDNVTIILATGSSDCGVPNEISRVLKMDIFTFVRHNSKHIARWYTQNCDCDGHPLIRPIPIGLDYHTLEDRTMEWGPQQTPLEQETLLKHIARKCADTKEQKQVKCFSYFHFIKFNRHGRDRHIAAAVLKLRSFNDFLQTKAPRKEVWEKHARYHFVVSPHGNGLDCHRTWEALALGCIPIVKRSTLDPLFEGMPVLIVNEWSDISVPMLNDAVERLRSPARTLEKLTLRYWVNRMKRDRARVLAGRAKKMGSIVDAHM